MTKRSLKYWLVNWLETIGVSVGIALLVVLFQLGGSIDFTSGVKDAILIQISLFPYYLFAVAAFVIMMTSVGYFQVYFSTLVSMNATRKEVAGGILGVIAANIVTVILMTAIIWKIVPGDIASGGNKFLVLFAGILFLAAAVSLVIGLVIVKWGKVGGIIFMLVCVLCGACAGFFAASGMFGKLVDLIISLLLKFDLWWTLVAGLAAYALAGLFIIMCTRKMEVRV